MTVVHFDNINGNILEKLTCYITKQENVIWHCVNNENNIVTRLWELIYCVTDDGDSSIIFEENFTLTQEEMENEFSFDLDLIIEENQDESNNAKVDEDFILETAYITDYEIID
jgi:hypothetical protein